MNKIQKVNYIRYFDKNIVLLKLIYLYMYIVYIYLE